MDFPPPQEEKGLKAFLKNLTPAQQAGGVLGGLALIVVIATPFLFGGASMPSFSDKSRSAEAAKKAAGGELFARKGGPASAGSSAGGFGSPASSPVPEAGDALTAAVRGPGIDGGGSLPMGGSRSGSGGAGGGGGGGPIGAQGVVNMGGGRPLGGGPSGTIPGGYTTAGATAKAGTARPAGPDGSPVGGGGPSGEHGGAGEEAGPGSAGKKPPEPAGKDIAGGGADDEEGGGREEREDSGKLHGFNPFKPGGRGGSDEEDDCTSKEAKQYDARIEQKISLYMDLVMERQDNNCRGIWCGRFSGYCNHPNPIVRNNYSWHCKCDRLACRQEQACREGHELNCARDRACGQDAPTSCANRACELDPY